VTFALPLTAIRGRDGGIVTSSRKHVAGLTPKTAA